MYFIYDVKKNKKYQCENKEDFLHRVYYIDINKIGHTVNDTYVYQYISYKYKNGKSFYIPTYKKEKILYILYENDRILNKYDVRKEAENWYILTLKKKEKERNKKYFYRYKNLYFEFRKDPVPFVHGIFGGRTHWFRKIKRGKREYLQMLDSSYIKYRRIAKKRELVISWGDDHIRKYNNNWKSSSKRKKQWK